MLLKINLIFSFKDANLLYLFLIQLIILFFVIFLLFCVNTLYCLFSLMGIIFFTSLFLLFAECEFFALIYLLIYLGAVIVFFLFTIMLLHLKFDRIFEFEVSHALAVPCFIIINVVLNYYIIHDFSSIEYLRSVDIVKETADSYLFMDQYKDISTELISGSYKDRSNNYTVYSTSEPEYHYKKFGAYSGKFAGLAVYDNYKIIGFVMYSKYGYLCFMIGFILLITMIGVIEFVKYAREDAAKRYELIN